MPQDTLNVATYLIRTVIRIQDTTYSLSSLSVDNSINIIPSIKGFLPKENVKYLNQKTRLGRIRMCLCQLGHDQFFYNMVKKNLDLIVHLE